MPVILDDIVNNKQAAKTSLYTPKFFSSKLTGKGGKGGVINENVNPLNVKKPSLTSLPIDPYIEKKTSKTSNGITVTNIPVAPLSSAAQTANGQSLKIPQIDKMLEVPIVTNAQEKVYVDITAQALMLNEDTNVIKGTARELVVQYKVSIFYIGDTSSEYAVKVNDSTDIMFDISSSRPENHVLLEWTYTPLEYIMDDFAQNSVMFTQSFKKDEVVAWLEKYNLYDDLCEQAEVWDTDEIADHVFHFMDTFTPNPYSDVHEPIVRQVRYLENYNVSLIAYSKIHNDIINRFGPDISTDLCKYNLNMLMQDTLLKLDTLKPSLSKPPSTPVAGSYAMPAHFSAQQKNAASTDEPLVMVQAGAGTGKSTVILSRIDHLIACGVKPSDITVLSFTNAAADNIADKNASIGSMTIARMIHDIYNTNYVGHELSSIDTMINSLDIFFPNNKFVRDFRYQLVSLAKNDKGAFTSMNNFIESNFDQVMEVLDTIKQTSLELEIIICYQKIDEMKEPAHVTSRYLIIDEVQDNSIFEFIFILKYVAKHTENLYIVGDSSQTLYEFRSSNPKALNALESSGVFKTYRLTTNYRSNQEILDFANVSLANIEANRFANIRLQANSLNVPTAKSFCDRVTLDYRWYSRVTEFGNDLPGIINTSMRDYIKDKLNKGEKVAFLAFTRREVKIIENALKKFWPDKEIANLVPNQAYATTVFSMYIKMYWNNVTQVAPGAASLTLARDIMTNLPNLSRSAQKYESQVQQMISDWWIESAYTVDGTTANDPNSPGTGGWVAMVDKGLMTRDEFFNNLRQCLLDYEIRHNAVKQALMGQKNKARRNNNLSNDADFIVSTIHSAKGLEFENVVAIHREDSSMSEADKRMYYVAFTRAMKTLHVLSYGRLKGAAIQSNYDLLVEALKDRDQAVAIKKQANQFDDDGYLPEDEEYSGPAEPVTDEEFNSAISNDDTVDDVDDSDSPSTD